MASLFSHRRGSSNRADPFIDLLFNTLLGFAFLFLVSLVFINPEADQANVEKKAEYIISATWPENLADDIDLWARAPTGHTVSYLQKEAGWLHLDRDDRGEVNDTIFVDGVKQVHPVNQEIITIRNKSTGEYVVNLYYYGAASPPPIPVEIKVDRVNPRFETVFRKKFELTQVDEERTVVRFTVTEDGQITNINRLPTILTPYALDHLPAWVN